jgi:hypothetical protein
MAVVRVALRDAGAAEDEAWQFLVRWGFIETKLKAVLTAEGRPESLEIVASCRGMFETGDLERRLLNGVLPAAWADERGASKYVLHFAITATHHRLTMLGHNLRDNPDNPEPPIGNPFAPRVNVEERLFIESSREQNGNRSEESSALKLPEEIDLRELWTRLAEGQGSGKSDREIAREAYPQQGEKWLNNLKTMRTRKRFQIGNSGNRTVTKYRRRPLNRLNDLSFATFHKAN